MISVKGKEKQFYLNILDNFFSKVDRYEPINIENINFSFFSGEKYEVFYGITKIVLVPKNKGARYVLKMPIIKNFMGTKNYCEEEVIAFQCWEDSGFQDLFAEVDFFTEIGENLVYIQERANVTHYTTSDGDDYDNIYRTRGLNLRTVEEAERANISPELIKILLNNYSSEEVEEFLNYCEAYNTNDLHSGNFGYSEKTKLPLIFDYSGI